MLLDTKLDGVLSPQAGTVAAFIVGVLAHVFLFRIGEWDLATLKLLGLLLFFAAEKFALTHYGDVLPIPTQLRPSVGLCGRAILRGPLLAGLFSSMLVYRGFLHRLRRFPGPFLARFSGLYMTIRGGRKMETFREVQKLHETYGDVIRVGKENNFLCLYMYGECRTYTPQAHKNFPSSGPAPSRPSTPHHPHATKAPFTT